MAGFISLFPRVGYNINKNLYGDFEAVTDITFRVNIIKSTLSNITTYYEYEIEGDETPEIVAEKFYRDPYAYWIILYANDIYDPQYDWPLSYDAFRRFIVKKYGSFEWAKTNIKHYEKVIEQRDNATNEIKTKKYIISRENLMEETNIDIKDGSFWSDLAAEADWSDITVGNKTISQRVYANEVTFYDYEDQLNDSKRFIKVIKEEYYPGIIREMRDITNTIDPMIRKLRV
jgi:hypothetical protein